MTTLRQKMIEEMTLREFSPRTQEAYLRAVTGLAKYHNQSPDKITKGMIRDYLLYLIQDRKLAWSSRNIQEVADIFRMHGKEYRAKHSLPLSHLKVMQSIEVCRTSYLGGHVEKCRLCGFRKPSYNSCRNRHCPKCQSLTKAKWLEARKSELLPVGYFHDVFTLPHKLNPLILNNKKTLFNILLKSVSETLLQFGKNNISGKLGFLCILHTWEQTLMDHFHLHCVIPAGALSFDGRKWIPIREDFLFDVKALSIVFRKKFVDYLKSARKNSDLVFPGKTAILQTERGFSRFIDSLMEHRWVVWAKEPFAGPEQALEYLGRYTHRVAISNNRILNVKDGRVTFTYRDRKRGNIQRTKTIDAEEFIRRFLLHVLPGGFMRIRHFGFLANRCKKDNIQRIRELKGVSETVTEKTKKTTEELMLELTGTDITMCPCCRKGTMMVIAEITPLWKMGVKYMDSS
ncbi:MAG TPA: IS91 family transposase [Nitrospirae bacterium]|nr:IS91 family transposase [Nitrospirota bacterium]